MSSSKHHSGILKSSENKILKTLELCKNAFQSRKQDYHLKENFISSLHE